MKVYGDARSGNCYKIRLTAAILGIELEWQQVNIMKGENRTAEFLKCNPNGKIPALQLDDGRCLAESNAIIHYLAHGTHLIPNDRYDYARMLQWQFFEQYSHEPFIAVARFIKLYLGLPEDRRLEFENKQAGGHRALAVMELQLDQSAFLVGETFTLADVSLYAYTHVAHEGGFDLDLYPAIGQWCKRVQAQPGYINMTEGKP